MEEAKYIVIFITTANAEEAEQISGMLVEKRKAACVNIIPEIKSHFRWEGKLEAEEEALLIVKTRASLLPEIINLVKQAHSYSVPEIIALPIVGGNQDYLDWIDESLS